MTKFSDYTKYGYSKMTDEEIKNTLFKYKNSEDTSVHKDSMYWKNEYMNFIEAENISTELFNTDEFHNLMDKRIDNFELADFLHSKKDINSRLSVSAYKPNDDINGYIRTTIRDHQIDIYKQRKLSL